MRMQADKLLAALAMLALSACVSTGPLGPPLPLAGTHWVRSDDADAAPHFPTLAFSDGRASGFDGCNLWNAPIDQTGGGLRFGQAATTRRACGADSAAATARRFWQAIRATRAARNEGDALVLLDVEQNVLARFTRD